MLFVAKVKRYKLSCKIRPYTLKSNFGFARKSPLLLGAGTLAAHRRDRLMLLGSPSDMVHGCRLRKTHSSPQQRTLRTASLPSSRRGSTPAIADFRCRAPLLPRLVWPYFTAYLYSITDFNINCKRKRNFFTIAQRVRLRVAPAQRESPHPFAKGLGRA